MRARSAFPVLCCLTAICCGSRRPAGPPVSELVIGEENRQGRMLRGFYESTGGWRWTGRVFAVSLDAPGPGGETFLELDFDLPHELMTPSGTVTLSARVNGTPVGRQSYSTTGRRVLACTVPPAALGRQPALVEFELDKGIRDARTGRPYGLIAHGAGLKQLEQTTAYRAAHARLAQEQYRDLGRDRALGVSHEQELEMMKLFHRLPVWQNVWFQNVRLIKNPLDLWMVQQVIWEVQPEFIVETGTWRGGSALLWASLLDGMGLDQSRVLTVDIQDSIQRSSSNPLWRKYVEFSLGSSTDPAIVSEFTRRVQGHRTIVMLDSDHAMQHVLRELRMYSPMVSHGSYLIVEDGHVDGVPTYPEDGPGPMAATVEFLKGPVGREFERDLSREGLLITFNPGGWLRRK
jgi:cephalosporin hydroxylase